VKQKVQQMRQKQLVMRDPALAALMGGIAPGGDFGGEFGFGFGDDDYGDDDDMGDDDVGDDFGGGRPTAQAALVAYKRRQIARARGRKRIAQLDPNKGSDVKVERYTFTMSQSFTIGTGGALDTNMTASPDTKFRPQVLTINAPTPGFGYLTTIQMANVAVSVGPGSEDMYNYSAASWGRSLDMPTLSPANRARLTGSVGTFVPPGYLSGGTFVLSASFKGPSSLAGGGSD
jgi:hypothetical protein